MVTQTVMDTTQKGERPRRFTLGDGLLVVAALAAGFAKVRQWANPHWCAEPPYFRAPVNASVALKVYYGIAVGVSWSIPFAIALTPALLVARFRFPRRPLEGIAEQPGTVACAAALAGMVLRPAEDVLFFLLDYLTHANSRIHLPSPPFQRLFGSSRYSAGEVIHSLVLESFPRATAPAVAAAGLVAWLVLVAIGRFRPERDWIDRTGRVLELPSYLLQYLTTSSSPIQLPSPPFIRWNGPPRLALGQIVQNVLLEAFPFYTAPLVGIAVLVGWLVLLANGRFLPERDWVDRTGRVLGIYWMALAVFTGVMSELWKFIS